MNAKRPSGRRLFLALLLAMGCFIASTAVSELAAGTIHDRTRDISGNALPTIEHISALRTELFHLRLILERDRVTRGQSHAAAMLELRQTLERIRAEQAANEQSPFFPGEQVLDRALDEDLRALDAAVQVPSTSDPARDARELDERVEAPLEGAQATAMNLVQFNADQAADLAARIEHDRQRAVWAAFVLDAFSAVLTLVVAFLGWRALRYYMDTQESQRELLSERASELEAFAGRVAHDILNPLNAVGLSLQLLKRGRSPEEVAARGEASLRRALRIIEGLLAFARAGARPDPDASSDVVAALNGVVADLAEVAEERGVHLELEAEEGLVAACSAGVVGSIAGNLVGNAVKYLVATRGERRVTVRARRAGELVRIEVEDTGPGIPAASLRTIFEPYVRGKDQRQPGIGLGLATAKKLSEAYRGRIGVVSEVGKGSTFWFELPARPALSLGRGAEASPVH